MARVEPSADTRAFARSAREMFLALLEQGFTEEQSTRMVAIMIGQAVSGSTSSGDK
jgi:hypothetical protein